MNKITPHLWFDTQAKEAADFYAALFDNSQVVSVNTIKDTPSGDTDIVSFTLAGQNFMAISAGPLFKFNPSVSFVVASNDDAEIEKLWAAFSEGGSVLMPLDSYPFSQKYGWVQDKYGLSWQIMHVGERPIEQKIIPSMMFTGTVYGKAEEAATFYTSLFENSSLGDVMHYGANEAPDKEGAAKFVNFVLDGMKFGAMDSARGQATFNEAISFIVNCKDQAEVDHFWENLSAVPEAEQCGWLKDTYGVSWQIVPDTMNEMMSNPATTDEQRMRVTQAFLKMKKFDIAELQRAYDGK